MASRMQLLCLALPVVVLPGLPALADDKGEKGDKSDKKAAEKPATTSDWTQFRGDPQLRGYRDFEVSDSPRLVWTYDAGGVIESSAALADGKAYLGNESGELLALDLFAREKEGKLLWKYKVEAGIRSSPGVRDGRVFFGDDFGFFHAVDAQSGKKIWTYETEGGAEIISSANFIGDHVLFGSYDGHLFCLSQATGKLVWKYLTGGPVHSTPALVEGKTFVAGCDELLRVIDATAGTQVREMEMGAYSAASPAVEGGRLFVGTFANEVIAVDWRQGKRVWSYEHPEKSFPFYSSAALGKGRLVVGGRDKMVHAVDLASGKSLWTIATRARVESSPLIAGDRVICASTDGSLLLLDLEDGRQLWSFTSDGGFLASPALARGRLVIAADNGLVYCLDVRPQPQAGKQR